MSDFDRRALINRLQQQASRGDREVAAFVILLVGGGEHLVDDDMLAQHSGANGSVRWVALLEDNVWSTTEEILVSTAVSLWRGEGYELSPGTAASKLDYPQFELWVDMMRARNNGSIPEKYRL